ncbi:MAG TPA: GNAT family N-acetyltransferase [Egicoccus sp.]|nr:GNAT family N-acetyltransferase [Egicoccus sp.]HSK24758.1 GNAT family N-acetyltransferase [Egicoccus sp.]
MSVVRPADSTDLRDTAHLHLAQLPGGFFARLGPGFLRRYHATFLTSPHAVAFVATGADEPVGFLVGTLDNRPHYRFVVKRLGLRLALRAGAAMLVRPALLWLFLRTRALRYARWVVRYPLRSRQAPAATGTGTAADAAPTIAVLTHVAVSEAAQGNGTGRALVATFLDAARAAGADEARLVTTAGGSAERFYDRLGWIAGEVRPAAGGEGMVREYRLPLRENAAP